MYICTWTNVHESWTWRKLSVVAYVVPLLIVVVGFALIMWGLARWAARARRLGIGTSVMSTVDELFHPAQHQTHLEILVQDERVARKVLPGDPPEPVPAEPRESP